MNQEDVLKECLETLKNKKLEYKNSPDQIGEVLKSFFPDGVILKTEKEFARFATLLNCIAKMNRYCCNFEEKGHRDSAVDLVNYASKLVERFDNEK